MLLFSGLIVTGALHRRYRAFWSQGEMTNRAISRNLFQERLFFRDEHSTVGGSVLSVFYLSRVRDAGGLFSSSKGIPRPTANLNTYHSPLLSLIWLVL